MIPIHRNTDLNDLPGEVWKPMINHEQRWGISNIGRVKRYKSIQYVKKKDGRNCTLTLEEKILVGTPNKKRYISNKLSYGGRINKVNYPILVHREVAKAFISNPNNYDQVNHINGDNQDNRVENLEWCNNTINQIHRYNILGREKTIIKTNKERIVKVHKLDALGNILKTYNSIAEAAKENGTFTTNICKVHRGDRAFAGGYSWRIDEESRKQRYRQDGKKRGKPRG